MSPIHRILNALRAEAPRAVVDDIEKRLTDLFEEQAATHSRRVSELHAKANEYLERARAAERREKAARRTLTIVEQHHEEWIAKIGQVPSGEPKKPLDFKVDMRFRPMLFHGLYYCEDSLTGENEAFATMDEMKEWMRHQKTRHPS